MLLVRQGMLLCSIDYASIGDQTRHSRQEQVVADLWERYLHLLDEGKEDGYVLTSPSLLCEVTTGLRLKIERLWTFSVSSATVVDACS